MRIIGIYGEPDSLQRYVTWDLLRLLGTRGDQPWFLGGDFNEILHNGEKGGMNRCLTQMAAFNSALNDCGLGDLGYEGRPFTLSNNQGEPGTVRCRLDRVCANKSARKMFPTARVTHLDQPGSDHIPILLQLERLTRPPMGCEPSRSDLSQYGSRKVGVRRIWEDSRFEGAGNDMVYKGEECRARLVQWSRDLNPNKVIDRLQRRIMELRHSVQTEEVRNEITQALIDLEGFLQEQSEYWRQRGKAAWMKHGDKNTAYFHAWATTRKQVNKIKGLQDAAWVWSSRKADMEAAVDGYF